KNCPNIRPPWSASKRRKINTRGATAASAVPPKRSGIAAAPDTFSPPNSVNATATIPCFITQVSLTRELHRPQSRTVLWETVEALERNSKLLHCDRNDTKFL